MAKTEQPTGVLREVESIKRLLIFALIRDGVSQEQIAKALGVNQSSISRMFPIGKGGKKTRRTADARKARTRR